MTKSCIDENSQGLERSDRKVNTGTIGRMISYSHLPYSKARLLEKPNLAVEQMAI